VKIGHKLQSLGKISNISAVLLGQFQHCMGMGGWVHGDVDSTQWVFNFVFW